MDDDGSSQMPQRLQPGPNFSSQPRLKQTLARCVRLSRVDDGEIPRRRGLEVRDGVRKRCARAVLAVVLQVDFLEPRKDTTVLRPHTQRASRMACRRARRIDGIAARAPGRAEKCATGSRGRGDTERPKPHLFRRNTKWKVVTCW